MADEFNEDDIVFAQKHGYIPWPGRLIDMSNSRCGLVQFMYTLDRHLIAYSKIRPYDEVYKKQFITRKTLSYKDFRAAIYITERMLNAESIRNVPNEKDLRFLHAVRQQRDSLHVEPLFIEKINQLRSSLTLRHQNYAIAKQAFQELLELPISQLLLIRNQEALESIRLLCRFVNYEAENQTEPQLVRQQAIQLMKRFASVFRQPFSKPNFWSEYCKLSDVYRRHTQAKS